MEILSFDTDKLISSYNKVLRLYCGSSDNEERYNMYNDLWILDNLIKENGIKLKPNIDIKRFRPSFFTNRRHLEEKVKLATFLELDELTREICYYWVNNLRSIDISDNFLLVKDKCSFDTFYEKIISFFEKNFNEDLSLATSTFDEEKVRLRRKLYGSKAEIFYLEYLKEYYINIFYSNRLSMENVSSLIHELGHASSFTCHKSGRSFDYVMNEVVASLYESLFIRDYFSDDKKDTMLLEFASLYKMGGALELQNYFDIEDSKYAIYNRYLNLIQNLYGDVISLTLLRKDMEDNKLLDRVSYIKENALYLPSLMLLKNIGIIPDDLVDTSKNMKSLILTLKG